MNAIAVHPQGYPHFCLTSTLKTSSSIRDFQKEREEIHRELLHGKIPQTCVRCFNKEKRGLQSRRTRTWERKFKIYGREAATDMVRKQEKPYIRHLEISFSNVCNLTCSICSSEFSSSWIAPDRAAEEQGLEFRAFTKPFRKVARVSKELLAEILEESDSLDLIIIKGGEPTREPLCLEFLRELSKRKRSHELSVFLQSNGTRPPHEWAEGLENLYLEVGFSIDGWGKNFDWIRGGNFDSVIQNFRAVHDLPFVGQMSIDFTLSAYNCFHLPEFFRRVIELQREHPKLVECPVFQWVQQPYASPLALKREDRLRIREEVRGILQSAPDLFLNGENLLSVLDQPRNSEPALVQARQWFDYMNGLRGFTLGEFHERVQQSLQ